MRQMHILLVEDNEADIFLMTEVLEERATVGKMSIARDGVEAIIFLQQAYCTDSQNLPDLILLDINLPRKNGFEVLQFIKQETRLKHIPVIMLSTSCSEKDIREAYENHANCFITKPTEIDGISKMVAAIEDFWFLKIKLSGDE